MVGILAEDIGEGVGLDAASIQSTSIIGTAIRVFCCSQLDAHVLDTPEVRQSVTEKKLALVIFTGRRVKIKLTNTGIAITVSIRFLLTHLSCSLLTN